MRTVRFIHRWLGLLVALPLMIQGLSGALLTLEPMLPHVTGSVSMGAQASPDRFLDAARAAAPPGMRPSRFIAPAADGEPAEIHLARAGGERSGGLVVRLDPVTASPLGPPEPEAGLFEWVRRLHENWLLPQRGGRQFSGWLGVGLLSLTLLGIPLWWPRAGQWRDGFTVPQRARGLLLYRRLHAAAGIWVSILLLATSTTGIMQGFPQTTRALLGLPAGGPPRSGRGGGPPPAIELDQAVRLASETVPGTVLRAAILPASAAEPIRLILAPPGSEGASTATNVTVDAAATRILSVSTPARLPATERLTRWAHDLHFGQGFGPVWRWLTAITGLSLPLFGVTGTLIWLGRRRNRRRVAALRQAALDPAITQVEDPA